MAHRFCTLFFNLPPICWLLEQPRQPAKNRSSNCDFFFLFSFLFRRVIAVLNDTFSPLFLLPLSCRTFHDQDTEPAVDSPPTKLSSGSHHHLTSSSQSSVMHTYANPFQNGCPGGGGSGGSPYSEDTTGPIIPDMNTLRPSQVRGGGRLLVLGFIYCTTSVQTLLYWRRRPLLLLLYLIKAVCDWLSVEWPSVYSIINNADLINQISFFAISLSFYLSC